MICGVIEEREEGEGTSLVVTLRFGGVIIIGRGDLWRVIEEREMREGRLIEVMVHI